MHTARLRTRYGETDRMGFVYHAHYLVYCEIGRTELLRSLGVPYSALESAEFRLVVTDARLRYRSPARYDEEIAVRTRVGRVGGASVEFVYEILREGAAGGELLAEGSTVLASIDANGKPRRFGPAVRTALERGLE